MYNHQKVVFLMIKHLRIVWVLNLQTRITSEKHNFFNMQYESIQMHIC